MNESKYISAVGRPGRILAARLLPNQDLVESIIELALANRFRSGTVTAIGSLRAAQVMYAKSMEFGDNPMDAAVIYSMEGPVEMGLAHGVFGTDENGEIIMHIHAMIMDKDGQMRCGNMIPGSAPVMATVELTIQELEGCEFVPTLDPEWNHKFLHPGPGKGKP